MILGIYMMKKSKLTSEEIKARKKASIKKVIEKRKYLGIAAKQFFIHKSLFKEAELLMQPLIEKTKQIIKERPIE